MNLGTLIKAIVTLIMLILGAFLIHTYWTEIVNLLEESWKILRETRIRYFILAFLTYILSVYLLAVRWQKVLSCIGYNLRATNLVPIYFGAVFVNNITPGGTVAGGDSFRILWANKLFGISYTNAFKTIFFERLVEAIPLTLLLIYVLYSFPSLEIKFLPLIDSLTLKSTHLLLLVFLAAGITIWLFRAKLTFLLMDVQKNWMQFKESFIPVLLLSCGVWTLDILRLKLVALSLNIHLPLNLIITVSSLSFLLGLLPLTPGGIGIIEGGLISILLYFGLSLALASSFVFLERFISFWLSSLTGFLCLFYYGGFRIWKNTKSH